MAAYIFGSVKSPSGAVRTSGSVSASSLVVSNVSGGYYTLASPGTYKLTANAPGCVSKTFTATLSAGQMLQHDFILST
jgi:hypothetical protein